MATEIYGLSKLMDTARAEVDYRRGRLPRVISRRVQDAETKGVALMPSAFLLSLQMSVIASGGGERDLYEPLGVHVALGVGALDPADDGRPHARLAHLAAANLLQIMGVEVDPDCMEKAADWLIQLDTVRLEPEAYHWSRGVAALALDRPLVYRQIAALPEAGAPPYDPNTDPGFNNQGWLALLAGAVESGISFDDAVALWRRFIEAYDALVEIEAIMDTDLAWVARIVRHRIGGHPLEGVADWLRGELSERLQGD